MLRLVAAVGLVLATLSAAESSAAVGRWTSRSSPPDALDNGAVLVLPDGMVMVAGGIKTVGRNAAASAEVELYDPTRDTWRRLAPMPSPRYGETAVVLSKDSVLIAGGFGDLATDSFGAPPPVLATSIVYDFSLNSWRPAGQMPYSEAGGTADLLSDGRVLTAGGSDLNGALARAAIFDPTRDDWSQTSSMHSPRSNASSVVLETGEVLVIGGSSGPGVPLDSAEVFDPTAQKWTLTSRMHAPRFEPAVVEISGGHVLAAGGGAGLNATISAEIYDRAANSWSETTVMPLGGVGRAFALKSGDVLVIVDNGADRTVHAALFSPRTSLWAPGPDLPIGSAQLSAVQLPSGEVLVVAAATVASFEAISAPPSPHPAPTLDSGAASLMTTKLLVGSMIVLLILAAAVYIRARLGGRA